MKRMKLVPVHELLSLRCFYLWSPAQTSSSTTFCFQIGPKERGGGENVFIKCEINFNFLHEWHSPVATIEEKNSIFGENQLFVKQKVSTWFAKLFTRRARLQLVPVGYKPQALSAWKIQVQISDFDKGSTKKQFATNRKHLTISIPMPSLNLIANESRNRFLVCQASLTFPTRIVF